MKYYKYLKGLIYLMPAVLFAVFLVLDFNPSGQLKFEYNFCRDSAFVSKLSPMGRVLEIEKNPKECRQEMVIDPVYFDLRLPQKYDRGILEVEYKKKNDLDLKIGPLENAKTWEWQIKRGEIMNEDDGRTKAFFEYDMKNVEYENNALRFIISSPGLDKEDGKIFFYDIKFSLEKDSLSRENWKSRVGEWLEFAF